MNKKVFFVIVILLCLVVFAFLIFNNSPSSNKAMSSNIPSALNIGRVDKIIGLSNTDWLIFSQNNNLFMVNLGNTNNVKNIDNNVKNVIMSNDNSFISYVNDKNNVISMDINTGKKTKYSGFSSAFWVKSNLYLLKNNSSTYSIIDSNNNIVFNGITSDEVNVVNNDLYVNDTSGSIEDGNLIHVIDTNTWKQGDDIVIYDFDSPIFYSKDSILYEDRVGKIKQMTNYNVNTIDNSDLDIHNMSSIKSNNFYFYRYNNNSSIDILSLDSKNNISKIISFSNNNSNSSSTTSESNIKRIDNIIDFYVGSNILLIQSNNDVWKLKL